jgi:hypothetical protein
MKRHPDYRLTVEKALKHSWIKKAVKERAMKRKSQTTVRGVDHQETISKPESISPTRHHAALQFIED